MRFVRISLNEIIPRYCFAEYSAEMVQRRVARVVSLFQLIILSLFQYVANCVGYFFSQHLDKSSEKSGETERLKQLMSENSSLKQKTFELQTQLQGLLQKLKNDKEKVRPF